MYIMNSHLSRAPKSRFSIFNIYVSVFDNEPADEGQEWADYVEGVKTANIGEVR